MADIWECAFASIEPGRPLTAQMLNEICADGGWEPWHMEPPQSPKQGATIFLKRKKSAILGPDGLPASR